MATVCRGLQAVEITGPTDGPRGIAVRDQEAPDIAAGSGGPCGEAPQPGTVARPEVTVTLSPRRLLLLLDAE